MYAEIDIKGANGILSDFLIFFKSKANIQKIPHEYIETIKVRDNPFNPKNEPIKANSLESPPPNAYLLVKKYIIKTKTSKPIKPIIAAEILEIMYEKL